MLKTIPIAGNDIRAYLKSARQPLTVPEERELVKRVKAGDEAAFDIILRSNIRFIIKLARKYQTTNIRISELVAEGAMGLRVGVERYNRLEIRLMSYANWWIQQHMLRYRHDNDRTVRIPGNVQYERYKQRKANAKTLAKLEGSRLKDLEASFLTSPEVESALGEQLNDTELSLDQYIHDDDAPDKMYSLISASIVTDYEETATHSGDHAYVKSLVVDALSSSKVDFDVFCSWYGVFGYRKLTLQELADKLGISRERVRQYRSRACKKLSSKLSRLGINNASSDQLYRLLRGWEPPE